MSAAGGMSFNAPRSGRGYKTEYHAAGNTARLRQPGTAGRMGRGGMAYYAGGNTVRLRQPGIIGQMRQGGPEYYNDGNTVRVKQPEIAEPIRQRMPETKHVSKKRADRVAIGMTKESISLPLTILLVAAVATVLIMGARYLSLKSSIDMHMDNVKSLETQLEKLKTENDALERSIDTSVDLNYVYDEAVGRLGMVRAGRDNIITFDKTESEYVRQYDEIPSE